MNKRQHKKLMTTLVAKLLARSAIPELDWPFTRPERKLILRETAFVREMLLEAQRSPDFSLDQQPQSFEWHREGVAYWHNSDCPREYLDASLLALIRRVENLPLPDGHFSYLTREELVDMVALYEHLATSSR